MTRPQAHTSDPQRPLLSLCMIVKDESDNLPRCLDSVRGVVDEIIVVDTGSTDDTREIAQRYGAKLHHFPWTGSFSEARNESLKHATGEWILWLDADEALAEGKGKHRLRELVQSNNEHDGFILPMVSFVGFRSHREGHVHPVFRVFRNLPGIQFERNLHEQISMSLRAVKPEAKFGTLPVWLDHYGYLVTSVRGREKVDRNSELARKDLEDDPFDPFAWYNLGREYLRMGRWQCAYYCLRRCVAHIGDTFTPYYLRAICDAVTCLQRLGRAQQALELLAEARQMPVTTPDLAFLEGQVRFSVDDWSGAIKAFHDCFAYQDELPVDCDWTEGATSYAAWHWIGLCRQKMGQFSEATKCFAQSLESALSQDRHFEPPLNSLIALQLPACRTVHDVLLWFEELLPGGLHMHPQLAVLAAKALLASYPLPSLALDCADRITRMAGTMGDRVDAFERVFIEAKLALLRGNYAEAAASLADVPLSAPEGASAWNLRILALALEDRWEEAASSCEADPLWTWLLERWRTDAATGCDGLPEALAESLRVNFTEMLALLLQLAEFERFEQALDLTEWLWSDGNDRAMALGGLYGRFECWDLAIETLVPAAQAGQLDRESWQMLARACQQKGMHAEAAEILTQLVGGGESKDEAIAEYMALAGALIAQGKPEDANQVLDMVSMWVEPAEAAVGPFGGGAPVPPSQQWESPAPAAPTRATGDGARQLLGKLDQMQEKLKRWGALPDPENAAPRLAVGGAGLPSPA